MTLSTIQTGEGMIVTEKSVTEGDIPQSIYYISFVTPNWYGQNLLPKLLPKELPLYYTQEADFILYETPLFESYWAGALNIARTKVVSAAWEVGGTRPTLINRFHELLAKPENGGTWGRFFSKVARDFLTTNNGAFIEIERVSRSAGSRITGLYHLDSRRCRRTGIPDTPVVYTDLQGREHLLKAHEVLDIVDMPEAYVGSFGRGMCAAHRAYHSIKIMNVMQQYLYEKLSGSKPLAIDFVTGISDKSLEGALKQNEAERKARGGIVYGGTVLVPLMQKEGIQHTRVAVAELPERFTRRDEFELAMYSYAAALGIDVQEILPLTGQPLGTGAQSQVLEDKEKGKGLVYLKQEVIALLQNYVFPEGVNVYFIEKDYRDQQLLAGVRSTNAQTLVTMAGGPIINLQQGQNLAADWNIIPKEMVKEDVTPMLTIGDLEKPEPVPTAEEQAALDAVNSQPTQPPTNMGPNPNTPTIPGSNSPVRKEVTDEEVEKVIDENLRKAREIFLAIVGEEITDDTTQ